MSDETITIPKMSYETITIPKQILVDLYSENDSLTSSLEKANMANKNLLIDMIKIRNETIWQYMLRKIRQVLVKHIH